MSYSQRVLLRNSSNLIINQIGSSDEPPLFHASTQRRVFLSSDYKFFVTVDNFIINVFTSDDFKKIFSVKTVSEEEAKRINSENQRLEDMISKIEIGDSFKAERIQLSLKMEKDFIKEIDVSPSKKYIVHINKYEEDGNNNFFIRSIDENKIIFSATIKNFNSENWPLFKWFKNSEIFSCAFVEYIKFYDAKILTEKKTAVVDPINVFKLSEPLKHGKYFVKNYSISPEQNIVGIFLKSLVKDKLARIHFYKYPNFDQATLKMAFRTENVEFIWASDGNALLLKTSANAAGYYSMVSMLRLVVFQNANGNDSIKEYRIDVGKGGFQDCSFSNKGDKFVVIGFEPLRAKLFQTKDCKIIHEFPEMKINRVIWSPNDNYLWMAGVVNMSGKMHFWDVDKLIKLGTGFHKGAREYRWSKDSKLFLTACICPFRKVDTGYKIYSFCGKLMADKKVPDLFQVDFIPNSPVENTFSPLKLSSEENDFLTKKTKSELDDENELGARFKIPFKIDIKSRNNENGRRFSNRGRGRGRKFKPAASQNGVNGGNEKSKNSKSKDDIKQGESKYKPPPRQIFGLPASAVDKRKKGGKSAKAK